MTAHDLRRTFDQARATAVLLEQGQAQSANPIGQTRVDFRPDPGGTEIEAVRTDACGQTMDAPPPTRSRASSKVTSRPKCSRRYAATSPDKPAPTTTIGACTGTGVGSGVGTRSLLD